MFDELLDNERMNDLIRKFIKETNIVEEIIDYGYDEELEISKLYARTLPLLSKKERKNI